MKYTLTQEAYISNIHSSVLDFEVVFQASAIDENGNDAQIFWIPYDNWDELDDLSEACDWDSPDFILAENKILDYWGELSTWNPNDEVIYR